MNEIKVSINRNGLLSKKIIFKILNNVSIDFNKHVHDIDIFINDKWRKYVGGDFSKLQGDLNFAFDQRESKVNLHKATSSPSNVSPDIH
jgi:uncharacterized protein YpuA (DUF1002 family)